MRILQHIVSLFLICLLVFGHSTIVLANSVVAAEAFIDTDPGEGSGVSLDVAVDGAIDSSAEVLRGMMDLDGLSLGVHVLNIRYLDSSGSWSPITKQSFYAPAAISGSGTGNPSILSGAVGRIDEGESIGLTADDGAFDDLVETLTLSEPVTASYHRAWIGFFDSEGISSTPGSDADGDGVPDSSDNCINQLNADQRDTDSDGFGNICDADLDNSGGVVNFADLAAFKSAFGTSNPDADFDGSAGVVNFADLAIFKQLFGKAPGPSCCGTLAP